MLLLLILILSILILGPLVERVYKGREKTNESIVRSLTRCVKMEFEKYIESSYEALAVCQRL